MQIMEVLKLFAIVASMFALEMLIMALCWFAVNKLLGDDTNE